MDLLARSWCFVVVQQGRQIARWQQVLKRPRGPEGEAQLVKVGVTLSAFQLLVRIQLFSSRQELFRYLTLFP